MIVTCKVDKWYSIHPKMFGMKMDEAYVRTQAKSRLLC